MFRSCAFHSISIEAKMRIKSLNCLQFAAHEFILNINFYFTFASLCETSFSLYLSFKNYIQTLYLTSTESKYIYLFAFWNSKRELMKDSGWKIYETQIQHIMILQAQTTFELFIKCSNKMKSFFWKWAYLPWWRNISFLICQELNKISE